MIQSGPGLVGRGDKSAMQTGVKLEAGDNPLWAVVLAQVVGCSRTFRICDWKKELLGKERRFFDIW